MYHYLFPLGIIQKIGRRKHFTMAEEVGKKELTQKLLSDK